MNKERLMTVLLGPHVSEKTTTVGEAHNQAVFRVRRDARKEEIAGAVELLFDVKVQSVQVLNQRGKSKRFGAMHGHRSDWKKAYVRLAPGDEIDFLGAD